MSASLRRRCPTETDTLALGERIGRALVPGDLLCLSGVLGAGKTVLVRGMALGAGIREGAVRSPTFVLHHVYRGPSLVLHHIDLYRLGPAADVALLDIPGLLEGGAVAIEWGEFTDVPGFSPLRISIDAGDPAARLVELTGDRIPGRIAAAWSEP
ncbi:MAG: tRNA (adenosine(37)-N6)-threonylcarbamoyltransferase complex ATPase subunit type 1 TsaE [Candidatus Eremiobacteraeota bacterium]|nr:tRNA (adenosine(37)-N6)-threonylcarbamoyltransferase complex ATPase subunit type 1 TsaE [Candidatus Eremiobacteraeota bacterium]